MTFIQITYDAPIEIAKGLATGELKMLGTAAIRDSTGITAHIREVSRVVGNQDSVVGAAFVKGLRNPKVVVIGLGVAALAAVGGGVVGWVAKRTQSAPKPEIPECVQSYNAALAAYLEAISSGSVNADVLSHLISALDAVKEHSDRGAIALEFSVEESEALVSLVADYTNKLVAANSVDLNNIEETTTNRANGSIIDFRRYLVVQRQIVAGAA
ncbi:hypothetical protein LO772_08085 [Yinghuangia sp. ASG 101]|uniref:hypothetical protein n=1 Tax=Yinghuangia sp. ASG 101 TaxID=2896848 RepID=UPI001E5A8003|nr:hypothetical protein [Yinghuangia sp. ASG 101]UGQ13553.1 hypothetical protein LO772_08085 [Yinghuangia sp. ASG 101]